MKAFLLLVLVVLLALIAVNRQRIYVRDPLATVYKTNARQSGKSDLHQSGRSGARASGKSELPQSGNSSQRQSGNSNRSHGVMTESLQPGNPNQSHGVETEYLRSSNSDQTQNEVTEPLQSSVDGVLQAAKAEPLQNGVSKLLEGGESGVRKGGVSSLLQEMNSDLLQGSRKDGRQSGVQVFVNVSGDVLLWQDAEPGAYRILVQGWNKAPGTPMRLTCIRWIVCLTDADRASIIPLDWTGNSGRGKGKYDPHVSMTGREVSFVNGDGATMRVELR